MSKHCYSIYSSHIYRSNVKEARLEQWIQAVHINRHGGGGFEATETVLGYYPEGAPIYEDNSSLDYDRPNWIKEKKVWVVIDEKGDSYLLGGKVKMHPSVEEHRISDKIKAGKSITAKEAKVIAGAKYARP